MPLDEDLRAQLLRSAERIQPEIGARLDQVVRAAHRRRLTNRAVTTVLAVVVGAAVAVGIPHLDIDAAHDIPPSTKHIGDPQQPAASDGHAEMMQQPLMGDWESDRIPSKRVRAAISAADIGDSATNALLGQASQWQTRMTFSWGGGGVSGLVVQISEWDASEGADQPNPGKLFYFRPIGSDELALKETTGGNPLGSPRPSAKTRLLFSYRIQGERLYLTFLGARPQLSDRAAARVIAWTTAPLHRMHY